MFIENKFEHDAKTSYSTFVMMDNNFPYYYSSTVDELYSDGKFEAVEESKKVFQFTHNLMKANAERKAVPGDINSNYFEEALYIFDNFCKLNKIKYKKKMI